MTPKKVKERLIKPEELQGEALEAFNKKTPQEQTLYRALFAAQEAEDSLAAARKAEDEARLDARRGRALAAGEKKLIAAVRNKEITLADVPGKIAGLVVTSTGATAYDVAPPTEVRESLNPTAAEVEGMLARITEAANKPATGGGGGGSKAAKIEAPSFKLTHSLSLLERSAFTGVGAANPDATLSALMRRYGMVEPIIATPDFTPEAGKLRILRGRRRMSLIPEAETIPTVIVTGFPDEYTLEAAEVALSRGRSLNVLRAGEIINRARQRGKDDATIRRDMGFKTGEVDKYAKALSLPPAILDGIREGRITTNTALLIGKQPAHIQAALAEDFTKRRGTETETAPARITEADVETARTANSRAAVSRDATQLSALTNAVTQADATGATDAQTGAPGAQIETGAASAGSGQNGGANAATEKELDTAGADGVKTPGANEAGGGADVEKALEELGKVLEAIPQDAPTPVLPLYRTLRDRLTEAGGGVEFANTPEDNPPAQFKAPKKAAVANTVESRAGWKASVIARFKPLFEALPNVPDVLKAFEELKAAVQSAKPGARAEIE